MTERVRNILSVWGIPVALFLMAMGAAQLELRLKEDQSEHDLDVERLQARDAEVYTLLLDIRCEQKPTDRRCK